MANNTFLTGKRQHLPIVLFSLLCLLTLLYSCNGNSGSNGKGTPTDSITIPKDSVPVSPIQPDSGVLTVAAINTSSDQNTVVSFYERESGYMLSKKDEKFDANMKLLTAALKTNSPIKITGDIRGGLFAVTMPGNEELSIYKRLHANDIKDLAIPRLIDVKKIDTGTFNRVEILKWPIFYRCTNVLPNYAKAKEIFDSCAAQSCNLGVPTSVTPCIPFQYVRDGCFARAHKMRYIIEQRFHYCSEKVFSYGINNSTTLAVRANKWGGCCVTWWYHVAPLVRVKIQRGKFSLTLAYVIDPGMFNTPVLLSTWLNAQEDISCLAGAGVGSYSIQPSSVYFPNGTTDPNYILTNGHLVSYNIPNTCP
ncbi:MAG: protein-glutamine glutaminase family protein [Ferruginibacter sp.]